MAALAQADRDVGPTAPPLSGPVVPPTSPALGRWPLPKIRLRRKDGEKRLGVLFAAGGL